MSSRHLRQWLRRLSHVLTQLSVEGAFHYDIKIEEIVKKTINFNDIWMVDVHLYFQLSDKLFHHVIFANSIFRENFYGINEMRFFFNRHYHFSKSPFSQLPHDTKIINSPICSEKEFHVINAISMKFHICKERGNFFDIFVIRVFTKIGCFMDKWRLDMHIGLILIG